MQQLLKSDQNILSIPLQDLDDVSFLFHTLLQLACYSYFKFFTLALCISFAFRREFLSVVVLKLVHWLNLPVLSCWLLFHVGSNSGSTSNSTLFAVLSVLFFLGTAFVTEHVHSDCFRNLQEEHSGLTDLSPVPWWALIACASKTDGLWESLHFFPSPSQTSSFWQSTYMKGSLNPDLTIPDVQSAF